MKIQKSQFITMILLGMTLTLIVLIIFIGFQLSNQNVEQSSISPKKTKAQSTSYSKVVAVNQTPAGVATTPTVIPSPTSTPTPTLTSLSRLTPTETVLAVSKSPGGAIDNLTSTTTVTPSITLAVGSSATISATVNPTKPSSLPKTGIISNSIIIFGAASLLIFFSFIL